MAINTAIIQHRRGSLEDFNPEKLMPGEIAVITDERSVHMGFPGGGTERIILEKDFTSESIKEKLGYEPADEERVNQLLQKKADYQYVDEKVSNVKVDLTGYAKEDYVDAEIEELNKKIVQETGKLSQENAELKGDLVELSKSVDNSVYTDFVDGEGWNGTVGEKIKTSLYELVSKMSLVNARVGDKFRLVTNGVGGWANRYYELDENLIVLYVHTGYGLLDGVIEISNESTRYLAINKGNGFNFEFYRYNEDIAQNKADIAQNKADIAQNKADIATKISYHYEKGETIGEIKDGLFNINTKTIEFTGSFYRYIELDVNLTDNLFLTGVSHNDASSYPFVVFVDANGNVLDIIKGDSKDAKFIDYNIIIKNQDVKKLYINGSVNFIGAYKAKEVDVYERVDGAVSVAATSLSKVADATWYNEKVAEAVIDEQKKNPFAWRSFDKGVVVFTFDDSLSDIDLVESLSEEYGVPVCFSSIPSKMNNVTTATGTNKKVHEVLTIAEEHGNEVLCHSGVALSETSTDEEIYANFVTNKKLLEEYGYSVRGIIEAGSGGGELSFDTKRSEKYLRVMYEYSDHYGRNLGMPQYDNGRTYINRNTQNNHNVVDACERNKTLLIFVTHSITDESTSSANTSESILRDLMAYVKTKDVYLLTFKGVYDMFRSSELENKIRNKVSSNEIIVSKSGTSIVSTDSSDNPIKGLKTFGKSTQRTTEGNQLFDASKLTKNHNSSLDILDDGYAIVATGGTIQGYVHSSHSFNPSQFGFNGKSVYLIADNITSSREESTGSVVQAYFKGTNEAMQFYNLDIGTNLSTKIDVPEYCTELTIGIYTNNTDKALDVDNTVTVKGLRLSLSNNTPWEPYTGGIPAPNPEHPQPIESVGDNGSVEVGVYGANLGIEILAGRFGVNVNSSISNEPSNVNNRVKTRVLENRSYYIVSSDSNVQVYVVTGDNIILQSNGWYDLPYRHVVNADKNVRFMFRKSDDSDITTEMVPIMFSFVETDYEEPKDVQQLTIPTPNGLPGIPVTDASLATYTDENGHMWCADEIDYERSVLIQRVLRKLFSKGNVFLSDDGSYFYVIGKESIPNIQFFYCNIAKHKKNNMDYANAWSTGDGRIIIGNLDANGNSVHSTVDELFSNIDMLEILVILAEPIETPLSAEELDQYKALTMNYPTTTILNDAYAYMEVKYSADTQNHIEQNYVPKSAYTALEARVATLEKNAL